MEIERLDRYRYKIPTDYRPGMQVPGILYCDSKLFSVVREDGSLEQVVNAAMLPGVVRASFAMPDIHYGYGLPIGGVIATDPAKGGVVTPGGVGFDINCGVRLLALPLEESEVRPRLKSLVEALFKAIPTGVGVAGPIRLSRKEMDRVLKRGSAWAVEQGYGFVEDLERTESLGTLSEADPSEVSQKAYERGRDQLGTLGSGNHFAEVQVVDEVFDEERAEALGLAEGQIAVMIHSGSRGLGHQVCTDFLGVFGKALKTYGISVPDRQLACAPVESPEGRSYIGAMSASANYAWANRQILSHWVREVFEDLFGVSPEEIRLIYDVAHNIAKFETHQVDGKKLRVLVHRKGATRALPPGDSQLPECYRMVGQPVVIPGDMGRASFLLCGEPGSQECFNSCCHGAGRVLSRRAAKKAARGRSISSELEKKGVMVRAKGKATLMEEMPEAYKDVSQVVEVVAGAGLARPVLRLRPLCVVKG